MQDINSIPDGGHHNSHHHHRLQPPLKCPRCNSLNTKFCYYNNYNLSQPRHFCKGCRRYWTKGGVLRNVPLGGGSRKPKRSDKTKPPSPHPLHVSHISNSHSTTSSDSSTVAVAAASTAEVVVSGGYSLNLTPETTAAATTTTTIQKFDQPSLVDYPSSEDGSMFLEMGVFSGMMTSENDEIDEFNELHSKVSNGGPAGSYDWRGDDGLFDLTRIVDHEDYFWSQNELHDYDKTEVKVRNSAQPIPTKKRRDPGEKDQGYHGGDNQEGCGDSFSFLPSSTSLADKKEELIALRDQVEDLHRKLSEKDELLKSTENLESQMSSMLAKLDELEHQVLAKDSVVKSTQLQLSDAKIKLADKQAALERLQWEAMNSNTLVEKLQENVNTMQAEMSSFMLLCEGLRKDDTLSTEDGDATVWDSNNIPDVDPLDEIEMQKMEASQEAYIAAVAAAKENQDEEESCCGKERKVTSFIPCFEELKHDR